MDRLSATALGAYRGLVYEDPTFADVLRRDHPDPRDLGAQHRVAPGVAHRLGPDPGPAGHPVGLRLVAVPADAARLVRVRHARSTPSSPRARPTPSCWRGCSTAGRSSAASSTTWAWSWPRPTSRSARATPAPSCPTTTSGRGSWVASVPSTDRTAAWHERITGSPDPLANNPTLARSIRNRYPYLDPLHVMQIELLRRHRAGERRRARGARHPAHDQRHRHRPAQQRLTSTVAAMSRSRSLLVVAAMSVAVAGVGAVGTAGASTGATLPPTDTAAPVASAPVRVSADRVGANRVGARRVGARRVDRRIGVDPDRARR